MTGERARPLVDDDIASGFGSGVYQLGRDSTPWCNVRQDSRQVAFLVVRRAEYEV